MSTKWQIFYISGAVAVTAEVVSNCRMQRGILIEFCEWPLSFIIRLLLSLNRAHSVVSDFGVKSNVVIAWLTEQRELRSRPADGQDSDRGTNGPSSFTLSVAGRTVRGWGMSAFWQHDVFGYLITELCCYQYFGLLIYSLALVTFYDCSIPICLTD